MDPLDGNAIAGPLMEYFGQEMTVAVGTCGHCGTRSQIAELRVYMKAPGSVVRCWHCGNVVIVLVPARPVVQVNLTAFRLSEPPA
ncbi:MAG: hypothetical protein JO244_05395 [Solirubrobacterales bacterium]|nr:hypothetical protein [Solirubrobacterales bacterium]